MEKSEFKKLFGEVAQKHGFQVLYGVWMKESPEVILMLELQKSNFSVEYYLNIKIFIHGILQERHIKNKKLVSGCMNCYRTTCPVEYLPFLDLENSLDPLQRKEIIESLFKNYIKQVSDKLLTIEGLYEFGNDPNKYLSPYTKRELERLLAKKQDQV